MPQMQHSGCSLTPFSQLELGVTQQQSQPQEMGATSFPGQQMPMLHQQAHPQLSDSRLSASQPGHGGHTRTLTHSASENARGSGPEREEADGPSRSRQR